VKNKAGDREPADLRGKETHMDLETAWHGMIDAFAMNGDNVAFLPGKSVDEVHSRLAMTWATPSDEVVEWFTLQNGLDQAANYKSLFYGFRPLPLDDLVVELWEFLAQMTRINSEADGELTQLDLFPKPTWLLLDDGDGKFVVDTGPGPHNGCVLRSWSRDLEVYADSIADFLYKGTQDYISGQEPLSPSNR